MRMDRIEREAVIFYYIFLMTDGDRDKLTESHHDTVGIIRDNHHTINMSNVDVYLY
jgi:hypothetical protein